MHERKVCRPMGWLGMYWGVFSDFIIN
jgi:hypothetical protein